MSASKRKIQDENLGEGSELLCSKHNIPITKIQQNSKRLLCELCLPKQQEETTLRLEMERVELTNKYKIILQELKTEKKGIQQFCELFLSSNMVEAKRNIKKSLGELQKLIDSVLDDEIAKANIELRNYVEQLLEPWRNINGKGFNRQYIEFQREIPTIENAISQKKKQIKVQIATRLKAEVRIFYGKIFEM